MRLTSHLIAFFVLAGTGLCTVSAIARFGTSQAFIVNADYGPFVTLKYGVNSYMQEDGNFVIYEGDPEPDSAIFASNTGGHDWTQTSCTLNWQPDGNLVVYISGTPTWSSNTAGRGVELQFTSQYAAASITGDEDASIGSAPVYWTTPQTGNAPGKSDPGAPSTCDGASCLSCDDCVTYDE